MNQNVMLDQFTRWLRRAARRDRMIYYRGSLMVDRGSDNRDTRTDKQNEIWRLADGVFAAHETGTVSLSQRRIGPDFYIYFATKL